MPVANETYCHLTGKKCFSRLAFIGKKKQMWFILKAFLCVAFVIVLMEVVNIIYKTGNGIARGYRHYVETHNVIPLMHLFGVCNGK